MDGRMKFPEVLQKLHALEFDYLDGEGMDFEPYKEFLPRNGSLPGRVIAKLTPVPI